MRTPLLILIVALLAAATIACTPSGGEVDTSGESDRSQTSEPGGTGGTVEAGEADETPTMVADAGTRESTDTPAAGDDDPADDDPADDDPADAEPTLDPTMEAFYLGFDLPTKGDPDAPVVLYEFSDYT
jgi:hypothetical protein